jgi:NADH dehydrogenase FAD-containing subunit
MTKPTRILILGGGFAGTTVALLSDTLSAPGSGKKSK